VLHGAHDDRHVDLCLHLQVEARLAHVAVFVRAEDLLPFEFPDVYHKAERAELLVEAFAVPGGGLTLLCSDIVLKIKLSSRQLLHEFDDHAHRRAIYLQLSPSTLLEFLGALKEVGSVHNQYTFA